MDAAITVIVGAAGFAVSLFTYRYQKKQLKLKGLEELLKELSQPSHREARKVLNYGITADSSAILGLGIASPSAVKKISANIVSSDLNHAATLIKHGLLDGSVFVKEYWWIILSSWDSLKEDVYERRKLDTAPSDYMRNLEDLMKKAVKYGKKHNPTDFQKYLKKYVLRN